MKKAIFIFAMLVGSVCLTLINSCVKQAEGQKQKPAPPPSFDCSACINGGEGFFAQPSNLVNLNNQFAAGANWNKVGDMVTVYGVMEYRATAPGLCSVDLTIPLLPSLALNKTYWLTGHGVICPQFSEYGNNPLNLNTPGVSILGNDRFSVEDPYFLTMKFYSNSSTIRQWISYSYMYSLK